MASATSSYDSATRRARYQALAGAMWTDRAPFDSDWRDLADYLAPGRARFVTSDRNQGRKTTSKSIDSTGRFTMRTLASGLHAGLTSPARPWMKLTTPDPDLAKHGPVKAWLHQVTERLLTVFATSNLYNALPIVYGDFGTFATAAMSVLEDPKDLFRAYTYPIGSYALGLDARGLVTTFCRRYRLSVRQVVEEFGLQEDGRTIDWSRISNATRALWDKGSYEVAVDVTWLVHPNEEARPEFISAKYARWASCYWETNGAPDTPFLRESGFHEFPVLAPRWDVTGDDTYGTDCPGMLMLGDVKQLQIMQREKGKAIAKQITPPLTGPNALRTQKTSLLPGDVTYVDVREGQQGLRSIHEVNLNLADMTGDIREVQYRIQRAGYEDLFLMLARADQFKSGQPPTAREIDERHEEKLLALGPVLERTNDELLDPLVDRVFNMLARKNLLPPAPELLQGQALKVEYVSILAQAQKLVGVVGQDRLMQTVLQLAPVLPSVVHKIDEMALIDEYADQLGVNPKIIRPTDQAEQILAEMAQQQRAQVAAEQAKTMAQAGQAAGNTPMGGDTALSRLVNGLPDAGNAAA